MCKSGNKLKEKTHTATRQHFPNHLADFAQGEDTLGIRPSTLLSTSPQSLSDHVPDQLV
jgi:hypothetical protein